MTKKLKGKPIVIAFYVIFVAGTLAATWAAVRHPTTQAYKDGQLIPVIKCIGIQDARTLTILRDGVTNTVHLVGVHLPSDATGRLHPAANVAKEDRIAKRALQAWIYRKRLQLYWPDEQEAPRSETNINVYAALYGVDIGRKLIQEGQAFAAPLDHPRRAFYEGLEAEAREAGKGIWRFEEAAAAP